MTSDACSGSAEPCEAPQEPASPSDTPGRIVELREEVDQLKEAVTSHATVDQAIGMMAARGRVSPDQGWTVLREVSQHTNIKLRTVAEMILVRGRHRDLPPDIRAALEDTLDKYGPARIPDSPPPRSRGICLDLIHPGSSERGGPLANRSREGSAVSSPPTARTG
jgi:hypothetical protein